jgi:hypothetical protein
MLEVLLTMMGVTEYPPMPGPGLAHDDARAAGRRKAREVYGNHARILPTRMLVTTASSVPIKGSVTVDPRPAPALDAPPADLRAPDRPRGKRDRWS